jgi:C4-type Zn-finger protein
MDEIVARDGPFYPQVWPHVVKKKPSDEGYVEEIEGLTELVYEKLPRAEMIQKERKKEVNRLLSARGRPY